MTTTPRSIRSSLRLAGRALLATAAFLAGGAVHAQTINDVPMAVKNNVAPNFMFLLDSSGSMLHIVPTSPYSPTATYSFTCTAAQTVASGSLIELNVTSSGSPSGIPQFRVAGGSTNYRHVSLGSGTGRCFANAGSYPAQLVTDSGIGDTTGRYTGHYLNWYFGAYDGPTSGWSGKKRLTTGAISNRWDVAKASATSVIGGLAVPASGGNALVRVGLSTYNSSSSNYGAALKSAVADLTSTSRTTLTGTTIPGLAAPSGVTPLASALSDLGRYMATGYNGNVTAGSVTGVSIDDFFRKTGTDHPTATKSCPASGTPVACDSTSATAAQKPIQQWCQRSYAFLVTDGRPTNDRSFNSNTYLRDYDGDCQGVLSANCVGAGAAGNWDRKTARLPYESVGGTQVGSDYLDDIAKALFDIDLRPDLTPPAGRTKKNNLVTYTIGFADEAVRNDPLLINTALQGGGQFISAEDGPALTTAFRRVITDAFSKDAAAAAVAVANAQITLNNVGYASSYKSGDWYGDLVSYSISTTSALQTGADIWSLRTNLEAQGTSRKIATWNGSAGVAFTDTLSYSGKPSSLTAGVINYLRGSRTGEGSTYRQRQYVLGDIINAEPVVVNYSGGVPIIFQGANDGMLHVVDGRTDASATTRGQELWAYVPKLLHADLADLSSTSYSHRYYIDGTPTTAEVTGVGSVSRMLVGGLGKGGRGYYALNISSYTAATEADVASKALWEFAPSGMGYSFGTPLIVKTAAGWRVVVASGYDSSLTGRVWVLDPADGTVLATLDTGAGSAGLAHLSRQANIAADAVVRYVWGGDLLGNVWRFDLNTGAVVKIASLTDAGGALAEPITAPPEVGAVAGSTTKFMVHVGTGRYLADEDVPGTGANAWATQRQSIYGLIDDTSVTGAAALLTNARGTNGASCPSGGGDGNLVCQNLTYVSASNSYQATAHPVDTATKKGWYVDLPVDAQLTYGRVVSKPALTTGGTLTLTVNIPTNVQCDPGGRSWFLALNSATGGAVPRNVGGSTYFDTVGTFLGYALASRPVIVTTADGKRALIRMSDKTVVAPPVPEAATSAAQWRRIYWRAVP